MPKIADHFQRILVPIDFAPASDEAIADGRATEVGDHQIEFATASTQAVTLAAAMVRSGAGEIRLLHATPPMQYSTIYTGPVSVPAAVIEEIHEKGRTTSAEALRSLHQQQCPDLAVDFAVRPGVPANVVLEEAQQYRADLIIMAASGRSRVARFFVGSTADRVIREAGCPVLVIPAGTAA